MAFFIVTCPGKGNVSIDGSFQGASIKDGTFHVFQCGGGPHDIFMECLAGKKCWVTPQRILTIGTNPILPQEVSFTCVV
jgi:hypothetical protein